MHVKPENRALNEISADFLKVQSPIISTAKIKARGFSVYAEDFSWVVDSSAMYDGALFLRMVRSFQPCGYLLGNGGKLERADQNELLGTLRLTVD